MIHFRDDKLIGVKFQDHFDLPNIDFAQCECWQTGSLYWALHSYTNFMGQNMLCKFGAELSILNKGGQINKRMIKYILNEIFYRYHRLTALISPENKQAIKFAKIAGFVHEGTLRKVNKGKDVNIFSLFREEYLRKWYHSSEDLDSLLKRQQRQRHQIQ